MRYAQFRRLTIVYSLVASHPLLLERSRDTKKRRGFSDEVSFRTTMTTCADKCEVEWHKLGLDLCLLIMDYFEHWCENCSFDVIYHLNAFMCPRDRLGALLTFWEVKDNWYIPNYRDIRHQCMRKWALQDLRRAEKAKNSWVSRVKKRASRISQKKASRILRSKKKVPL